MATISNNLIYPPIAGAGGGVVYTQQYSGGPLVYMPSITTTLYGPGIIPPQPVSVFPSPAFSDDEIERAEKIMEECDAARAS